MESLPGQSGAWRGLSRRQDSRVSSAGELMCNDVEVVGLRPVIHEQRMMGVGGRNRRLCAIVLVSHGVPRARRRQDSEALGWLARRFRCDAELVECLNAGDQLQVIMKRKGGLGRERC